MCDFAILTRLVKIQLLKFYSRFLKFRFKILLARRNVMFYAPPQNGDQTRAV